MCPRTAHTRTATTYAAGAISVALVLGMANTSTAQTSAPDGNWAISSTGSATAAALSLATVDRARAGKTLPGQIGARPGVHQMVTVTAKNWSTRYGTLKAWQRDGKGHWRLAHGPVPVVAGYNGWVRAGKRVQSTGTTPAGRFTLPYTFGRLANPGAHVSYRRFDRAQWWPYEPRDPATYNVWQWHKARTSHWRADNAEHLWDYYDQYAYGLVIGFNLPTGIHYSHRKRQWVADHRADTRRGGGIFLHVRGDGATAGCVATGRSHVRWLIRWLRPEANAQIVMGPYDYVVNL